MEFLIRVPVRVSDVLYLVGDTKASSFVSKAVELKFWRALINLDEYSACIKVLCLEYTLAP